MGNHVSSDVWTKLRERTTTLTMLDLARAAHQREPTTSTQLDSISEDDNLHKLVTMLADRQAGALLVKDADGNVTNTIDIFRVTRYILHLYDGATWTHRSEVVHETYDFWTGWEQWVEHRARDVPTPQASHVIRRAAMSFFIVSVKEVLEVRSLERFSRTMHAAVALPETALLREALHYWAEGYTNLVVRSAVDGQYRIVSQADVLAALATGLVDNNLQGAGGIRFSKLGISRTVLLSVRPENRALQAFRLMSDRAIQAAPVTDEHGNIKGEMSLSSLRTLRPDNFHALLGTVAQFQDMMAYVEPPLTVPKHATIGNVIDAMSRDPLKRTHVWVTSRRHHQLVRGVVSLSDIVHAIIQKLQSE